MHFCFNARVCVVASLASAITQGTDTAFAQVVPDLTLGTEGSVVAPAVFDGVDGGSVNGLEIGGGAQRGPNLFHSFSEFGVLPGEPVYFVNPAGVANIFSRVTGDGISRVDDVLGVSGPASLFLLNPNGIVFGPGARLDISGSFVASTAAEVEFSDGTVFGVAAPENASLLTLNVPLGLQLNTPPQGEIESSGELAVGQDLTLVGNQLNLSGELVAGEDLTLIGEGEIRAEAWFESGRDLWFVTALGELGNLVSDRSVHMVAGGDVLFGDYTGTGSTLEVISGGSITANNIRIIEASAHLVSDGLGAGEDSPIDSQAIILQAGLDNALTEIDSEILVESLNTSNNNGKNGGEISVKTNGDITINSVDSRSFSSIFSPPPDGVVGNGGNISISSTAGSITTREVNSSSSRENGGNISITSNFGNIGILAVGSNAKRNGGDIHIISISGNLAIKDISSASSAGNGGDINVSSISGDITTRGLDSISALGDGGDISISSTFGELELGNAHSFTSYGNGGDIHISSISGEITANSLRSFSSSNGGNIVITSTSGDITAGDFDSYSGFHKNKSNGGDISISSTSGDISVGKLKSLANNGGDGGDISISSTSGDISIVSLNSSSLLSPNHYGTQDAGDGGNISISSASGDISTGAISSFSLSETGTTGKGGSVSLLTSHGWITSIVGLDRQINTIAISGKEQTSKQGGNVNIAADQVSGFDIITTSSNNKSGDIRIANPNDSLLVSDITIVSSGQIEIPNPLERQHIEGDEFISLAIEDIGESGNLWINSVEDITLEGIEARANANGTEAAGNIVINSPGIVRLIDSRLDSNTSGKGNAGEITINSAQFYLDDGGYMHARTSGLGKGGNISINAHESIEIGKGYQGLIPLVSVESNSSGRPGNIKVNTPRIVLSNTARITTESTQDATHFEDGGILSLSANEIKFSGNSGVLAKTQGRSPGGLIRIQPYNDSQDLKINLDTNSFVSASTDGSGQGGSILIEAPRLIQISGEGQLSAETSDVGFGGGIQITTSKLIMQEGIQLSTTAKALNSRTIEIDVLESENFPPVIVDVDASGPIPSSGTVGRSIFTFLVPTVGDSITDVDLRFSAAHTFNEDLSVSLESPAGTQLELFSEVGSDGENFQDTLLDDSASESILDASAPFSGSFKLDPEKPESLSIFNNENATGTWKLFVTDQAGGDSGVLFEAGEPAPWGVALGTQLLLETQSTRPKTKLATIDVAPPRPTLENPNLGRGGTVTIQASQLELDNARILADTEGFTRGGSIVLLANTAHAERLFISLDDQSRISASNSGEGIGGALHLSAPESIVIAGNGKLSAETSGTGNAGQVQVQTPNFTLQNNAQLSTSTTAQGNGGTLSLNVSESVTLNNNAGLIAQSTNTGNAGNIQLTTANLSLTNQSQIATSTAGEGNAGNITLNPGQNNVLNINIDNSVLTAATSSSGDGGDLEFAAPNAINITGNGTLTAQTSATGSAGNVRITADRLTLDQGTTLSTTATATANPPANEDGSKANINLNANEMNLFGTVQILSETQGNAKAGKLTLQTNGAEDLNINLRDNSKVSASTSGNGNGGELSIRADNHLTISGRGTLSAETSGKGSAGAVKVQAQSFTLQNGATLSTSTTGSGTGGNISVTTEEGITLRDRASLIAESTETASGKAGDVTLRSNDLTLDDASITVSSQGTGDGGNINVGASRATFMRNSSVIETDAANSGNGGNIQLDTPILIGYQGDNSDIIANAQQGNGGQIEITAKNILNFEQQDGQNKTKLRSNTTNDISASSEGGTDGIITLNTPETDPADSLSELPTDIVDGSRLISQNLCRQGQGSEFIVTGRGGLPQGPQDTLQAPSDWEDWRFPEQLTDIVLNDNELNLGELRPTPLIPIAQAAATKTQKPTITEAQGWQKTATGAIQLIAAPTQPLAVAQATSPLACRQLKRHLPR